MAEGYSWLAARSSYCRLLDTQVSPPAFVTVWEQHRPDDASTPTMFGGLFGECLTGSVGTNPLTICSYCS
jgi:hypothetical protein